MERERLSSRERPAAKPEGLERLAAEKLRQLEKSNERPERREHKLEAAREKLAHVEHAAKHAEAAPKHEPTHHRPVLTKEQNYRNTMASLRHRMKPAARRFSKVIHAPAVEAASNVAAKTIMRPSVALGAPLTALIITGGLYLFARENGFLLPNSVVLIALLIGAAAGLAVEGLYRLVVKRRG